MSEDNTANTNIEETEKPVKATTKKADKEAKPQDDFLTNFNWHQYQEGIDELDDKQITEFEKLVKEGNVAPQQQVEQQALPPAQPPQGLPIQ